MGTRRTSSTTLLDTIIVYLTQISFEICSHNFQRVLPDQHSFIITIIKIIIVTICKYFVYKCIQLSNRIILGHIDKIRIKITKIRPYCLLHVKFYKWVLINTTRIILLCRFDVKTREKVLLDIHKKYEFRDFTVHICSV